MNTQSTLNIYASAVSIALASLANFGKYDMFWLIFSLGGIFIMIGHQIFDQKIKHSFGKIVWMVTTSFLACLFIKFLYNETYISLLSMIISTLVASMIAPATISIVLVTLPDKVAEQIAGLPEWLFGILKKKIDKNGDS